MIIEPARHLPLGAERSGRRPELPSLPVRPARPLRRQPRRVLPRRRLPRRRSRTARLRRRRRLGRRPLLLLLVADVRGRRQLLPAAVVIVLRFGAGTVL